MIVISPILQLFFASLIFFWLIALTAITIRRSNFIKRLTKGKSSTSLEEALKYLLSQQDLSANKLEEVKARLETLHNSARNHYQKMGFVRFNPYADTGGNQSFCLCLLNDYNDGIVITSLHSREQTRMYAKPVIQNDLDQKDYSKEESESIKQAISGAKNQPRITNK